MSNGQRQGYMLTRRTNWLPASAPTCPLLRATVDDGPARPIELLYYCTNTRTCSSTQLMPPGFLELWFVIPSRCGPLTGEMRKTEEWKRPAIRRSHRCFPALRKSSDAGRGGLRCMLVSRYSLSLAGVYAVILRLSFLLRSLFFSL